MRLCRNRDANRLPAIEKAESRQSDVILPWTGDASVEQPFTLKDAENNLTTYEYDGFDRLSKTRYPLPTQGSNASSTTDYEQLGYDAASNVTSRRLRDAQSIAFTYDNLNRVTLKDLPGTEPDVTYAYDNLGRLTSASQTGNALSFTYDALSRNLTQAGPQGTVASQWDLAGRRTKLTYPGSGLFIDYDYLVTGEVTKLRENGATSGVGVLATYAYDDLGRRTGLTFGNGAVQSYGYDPVSRLASLTNDLASTANDLSQTFAYNPASQIASTVRTGDAYAWTGHFNENKTGTPNGLNQLTQVGAKALLHDSKGNVTAFGTKSFSYSSENLLLTGPNGSTLGYDPLMRLYETASGGTSTRFAYDGLDRIAEYDGSNALQRRYVHGPGIDEPIVWYEGAGTTDRRFLGSDERGSIISVTDSSGTLLGLNKYDEFGNPQAGNLGIWGYTGQAWLPTMGIWYYKAREYDPELGRFLQTDLLRYIPSANLYTYVWNQPINFVDPLGLDPLSTRNAAAAQKLFGSNFSPRKVSIQFGYSSLPRRAITIGNTIYVRANSIDTALLFHELTHTWQFQSGLDEWALFQAQLSDFLGLDPYNYEILLNSDFYNYNTEAQAAIVGSCIGLKNPKSKECGLLGDASRKGGEFGGLSGLDDWRHFFSQIQNQFVRETRGTGFPLPGE